MLWVKMKLMWWFHMTWDIKGKERYLRKLLLFEFLVNCPTPLKIHLLCEPIGIQMKYTTKVCLSSLRSMIMTIWTSMVIFWDSPSIFNMLSIFSLQYQFDGCVCLLQRRGPCST